MFFYDVHTHTFSSDKNTFSIVNTYPNSTDFSKPFSIGIHPWYINKDKIDEQLLLIEEKLKLENCFAIGECGLDKITEIDFKLQKEVFKKQVHLSGKYQKPLIIHCVKSHQEIIEIKKEINPNQTWIIHGFNKNLQVAESLIINGIILSFGAAIINNKKLQEVVSKIPISSILLETDTSENAIEKMYLKIAEVKNINLEDLQSEIKQNFKSIFKK